MSFSGWKESKLGIIPFEWEVVRIEEIADVVSGGTPSTKKLEYYGDEIAWITPKDLSGYTSKYIFKGQRSITQLGLENSSAHLLPSNTVLFSSRAPIGYVAISGDKVTTNQGFKNLICDSTKADYQFIYYKMKTLKESLEAVAGGSTFKEVSGRVIKEFNIVLPPLQEQKAIANILSSLDEKIELNNQMNKTLEEMAQALFKRWFVDFEFPNEDGKPYKSSDGEMVDSELGMIPKGWISTNIGEVSLDANTGADAIRRAPIVEYDTGIRCVRVGDLSNKRGVEGWGYCEVSDVDYEKFRLRKGDILVTRTGTIGLNTFINEDLVAVFNNGLIRLRINKDVSPLFIYQLLNQSEYYNYISKITGETSTRPNMKINYLLRYKFVLPHEYNIINKFIEMVGPLYARINLNQKEIMTLKNARDTLLPKLMSGEIRVTDLQN